MRFSSNRVIILILIAAGIAGIITSILKHRQPKKSVTAQQTRVFHHPLTFVAHLKNDPEAGKKIFHEYCASCHGKNAVIPVGAPRIGNKVEWAPFKKIGLKQLLQLATKGYGAMPARGGCFECTDEQLKKAIEYILKESD